VYLSVECVKKTCREFSAVERLVGRRRCCLRGRVVGGLEGEMALEDIKTSVVAVGDEVSDR
jgi:hypothetical protein